MAPRKAHILSALFFFLFLSSRQQPKKKKKRKKEKPPQKWFVVSLLFSKTLDDFFQLQMNPPPIIGRPVGAHKNTKNMRMVARQGDDGRRPRAYLTFLTT